MFKFGPATKYRTKLVAIKFLGLLLGLIWIPFLAQAISTLNVRMPFALNFFFVLAGIRLLFLIIKRRKRQKPMPPNDPAAIPLLRHAFQTDDVDAVRKFYPKHEAVALRHDENLAELSTLHHAAAHGALKTVMYLLGPDIRADACAQRNNAFTPLHAAAMHGHTAICKLLVEHGASVNAQTIPQGYSPLHSAAFAGHLDTIRFLLSQNADTTLRNYRDETPSMTAKRTGQSEACVLINSAQRPPPQEKPLPV
jgi:hypothetical protein